MRTEFIYDGTPRFVYLDVLISSRYTGKERDNESGLDNFEARYYSSAVGRFMSPDWSAQAEPVPYAKLNDPQSLNLYAYVQNNPLSGLDPDGHDSCGGGNSTAEWMCQNGHSNLAAAAYGSPGTVPDSGPSQPPQQQAQQQSSNSSSNGSGFWNHVDNLLHGHSWNYEPQGAVTATQGDGFVLLGAESNSEPDRYVTLTDGVGIAAAVADNTKLGVVNAGVSIWNDPNPLNKVMNGASFLPEMGLPVSFMSAESDLLNFEVQTAGEGMIEAIPGKMMDDGTGSGQQVPAPAEMNVCEALGGNGC